MPPFSKLALPLAGSLVLAGVTLTTPAARAQGSPPPLIGEELQRARNDFAAGGIRRLSADWYACVDSARDTRNANTAERCVVYGDSALLLGDADQATARTPWMRHLTADIVAPGQFEMLAIMGIPDGPRPAWLDRYRRWVAEVYARDANASETGAAPDSTGRESGIGRDDTQEVGRPYGRAPDAGEPYGRAPYDSASTGADPDDAVPDGGSRDQPGPYRNDPPRGAGFARPAYEGVPYGRASYPDVPYSGVSNDRPPLDAAPYRDAGAGGSQAGEAGLARLAAGQYPKDALRDPDIAGAVRRLVGPGLLARLRNFSFGAPMVFTGRYTSGVACGPRGCDVAEARFVFSSEDVWIGLIRGGRMRLFGDPPRQAKAFLMRDANQVVWRGPVDDMTRPPSPRVIRTAAEPLAPGPLAVEPAAVPVAAGPPPRMSIAPRPFLDPPVAAPRDQADSDTTVVPLRNHDGNLEVPVLVNNTLTVAFTIDSGSSDVSVSSDVLDKLMRSGTVSAADFRGKQVYHLADGSSVASETFRIRVLKVGDREIRDVMGSVTKDANSLLLGQSFLRRFRSWSIDNQRQVLLLK